jgi:hypothetical protein
VVYQRQDLKEYPHGKCRQHWPRYTQVRPSSNGSCSLLLREICSGFALATAYENPYERRTTESVECQAGNSTAQHGCNLTVSSNSPRQKDPVCMANCLTDWPAISFVNVPSQV